MANSRIPLVVTKVYMLVLVTLLTNTATISTPTCIYSKGGFLTKTLIKLRNCLRNSITTLTWLRRYSYNLMISNKWCAKSPRQKRLPPMTRIECSKMQWHDSTRKLFSRRKNLSRLKFLIRKPNGRMKTWSFKTAYFFKKNSITILFRKSEKCIENDLILVACIFV